MNGLIGKGSDFLHVIGHGWGDLPCRFGKIIEGIATRNGPLRRQRAHKITAHVRVRIVARCEFIESAVDRAGGTRDIWKEEDRMQRRRIAERFNDLAKAAHDRRSASNEKGNIGPDLRSDGFEFTLRHTERKEFVESAQHRSGVA